jgi:hypothetical protein
MPANKNILKKDAEKCKNTKLYLLKHVGPMLVWYVKMKGLAVITGTSESLLEIISEVP